VIPKLEQYATYVGKAQIRKLKEEAKPLKGRHISHINSVATGGGVAEILNSLVLLMNTAGIKTGWRLFKASESFFQVTKKFHNALQGEKINFSARKKRIYLEEIEKNSIMNHFDDHDLIVVHDPQPLAMIKHLKKKQTWLWRCHIDIKHAYPPVWNFISRYIRQYDGMLISMEKYKHSNISIPNFIVQPSIDPLSFKNRDLSQKEISRLLWKQNIDSDKPIVCMISRFDKWKNHDGVLKTYAKVRKKAKCQLVLMGSSASDDPESLQIFADVNHKVKKMKDVTLITHHDDFLVNALQREAKLVYQMSLREGFGLTVSEALWKKTPVIATNRGGIPLQVIDGKTGFIVHSPGQAADATLKLLKNPKLQEDMGAAGREHVKNNFLITRHLHDYLRIFNQYLPAEK